MDGYDRVLQALEHALCELTEDDLNQQPHPDCNTMGWLAWHLTRVQDDHIADLMGQEQLWVKEGWYARPNDLLHWKIMEMACERKMSRYYMGMIGKPIPTKTSKVWGLWRWKREWNGDLETIHFLKKFYIPKYRFILKAKEVMEHGYQIIKKLRY